MNLLNIKEPKYITPLLSIMEITRSQIKKELHNNTIEIIYFFIKEIDTALPLSNINISLKSKGRIFVKNSLLLSLTHTGGIRKLPINVCPVTPIFYMNINIEIYLNYKVPSPSQVYPVDFYIDTIEAETLNLIGYYRPYKKPNIHEIKSILKHIRKQNIDYYNPLLGK